MFKFLISTHGIQQIYEDVIQSRKRDLEQDEGHLHSRNVPFRKFVTYLQNEYHHWRIEKVKEYGKYHKANRKILNEGTCVALTDIMDDVKKRMKAVIPRNVPKIRSPP